jgi:predicted TIM-barrel fold metal-dependent hydrolase
MVDWDQRFYNVDRLYRNVPRAAVCQVQLTSLQMVRLCPLCAPGNRNCVSHRYVPCRGDSKLLAAKSIKFECRMKTRLFISVVLICVLPVSTTAQDSPEPLGRIYLDEFRPQAELKVPVHILKRARFPCVNVHSHPGKLSDAEIDEMVRVMDESNIAVSVSLDGRVGSFARHHQKLTRRHPGRFVVFLRMDYQGDGDKDKPESWDVHKPGYGQRMADHLSDAVRLGAVGLKLTKELGLYLRDRSGTLIKPDDPRFDPVWQRAGELGIPVLWHCADPVAFFKPTDEKNERWEELHRHPEWSFHGNDFPSHQQLIDARNRVVARHPKTKFICAHMADIPEDLKKLGGYLDKYPNMHVEIAARVAELGRQPYTARRFFIKYADRILFGTDGVPPISELIPHWRFLETWDENFPYEDNPFPPQGLWNIFGLGLPDAVLWKIYHQNATRLIPGLSKAIIDYTSKNVELPKKEDLHLFLLLGQSNMAGRGKVTEADKVGNPRVLALGRDGRWKIATDPLHFDKPGIVGVGPGRSFADVIAESDPKITIGLIPCAVGGSPISAWEIGGYHEQTKSHPYDDALPRVRHALQTGVLKGILWHQGESDSKSGAAEVYEQKLHKLITRLRIETSAPDVPFIAGQMGRFAERPWSEAKQLVDRVHRQLPEKMSNTAVAKSDGLTHKGDKVHFDSESCRLLGIRFAEQYLKLVAEK